MKFAAEKRVTITCSPNFGYRHFLRALGEQTLEGVDLSSIRMIFNGAEPISVELAGEFLDRLDDLVPMTRPFSQQVEHDQLEVALLEHPFATASGNSVASWSHPTVFLMPARVLRPATAAVIAKHIHFSGLVPWLNSMAECLSSAV